MFRGITGASLMLLATGIMLAHNVIPHHHHPEKICFPASCSPGGVETSPHHGKSCDTEKTNGPLNCQLKQDILPSSYFIKLVVPLQVDSKNPGHPFQVHPIPAGQLDVKPWPSGRSPGYFHRFPDRRYLPFVHHSIGLRAPPFA